MKLFLLQLILVDLVHSVCKFQSGPTVAPLICETVVLSDSQQVALPVETFQHLSVVWMENL